MNKAVLRGLVAAGLTFLLSSAVGGMVAVSWVRRHPGGLERAYGAGLTALAIALACACLVGWETWYLTPRRSR